MLSRVADSIYWMSRYIERAENVARFMDVNLRPDAGFAARREEQWEPMVNTTGDHKLFTRTLQPWPRSKTSSSSWRSMRDIRNSILSCLRSARENARSVREVISSEMWEQLNEFYLMVN